MALRLGVDAEETRGERDAIARFAQQRNITAVAHEHHHLAHFTGSQPADVTFGGAPASQFDLDVVGAWREGALGPRGQDRLVGDRVGQKIEGLSADRLAFQDPVLGDVGGEHLVDEDDVL